MYACRLFFERTTASEAQGGSVDLAINGSYLTYLYVVLLQISVLYLQRPDPDRRLRDQKPSATADFYSTATGFIGTALNWANWLLAAYVAQKFGMVNGVLFLFLAVGSSIFANIVIPRVPRVDQVGHVISVPATILLIRAVLLAVGIETGL